MKKYGYIIKTPFYAFEVFGRFSILNYTLIREYFYNITLFHKNFSVIVEAKMKISYIC